MSLRLIIEHKDTKEKKDFYNGIAIKNFAQTLFLEEQPDNTFLKIPLSSDEAIVYLENDSENWQVIYKAKEKLNWEY